MRALADLVEDDATAVTGADGRGLTAADLRRGGLSAPDARARVALVLHDPTALIRAVVALDGQVEAILPLNDGLDAEGVDALVAQAGCTRTLTDRPDLLDRSGARRLEGFLGAERRAEPLPTRWLMTTSGTTGLPKVVPHTLRSLSRSVTRSPASAAAVWGLLYDPTRFAGMQVVLQALVGGGRLVVADRAAPLSDQVALLAREGVTHLSATPTLWRRILMTPGHRDLALRQATLGGEIVDQGTLTAIAAAFPEARLSHIYASTEAGVGFSVTDRLAGFPSRYLDAAPGGVRLKVVDNVLWLRAPGEALPRDVPGVVVDEDGFVRSGDRVERDGERLRFLGRDNGTINVGGVKVHPERIEAVIGSVPGVLLARVSGKRSPLTGALVVAEVMLEPGVNPEEARARILDRCRAGLEREAVPATLRFVDGFATNSAGKLVRTEGAKA